MVVYDLACDNAHSFEGWFASADAFDQQAQSESVGCPVCGSNNVIRQPSAPYINKGGSSASQETTADLPDPTIHELRAKVLDYMMKNSEDVGKNFPDEARRIHHGESPERAIRGLATRQQAHELKEEGIEVVSLPMAPVPPDRLH